MNKKCEGFDCLRQKFPCISKVKIKYGIFISPQVKQLFQDPDFKNKLNAAKRRAWDMFENICSNFWGYKKSENYVEIMEELLSSYHTMGCNMSLKLNFQQSHWDFFLKIWKPSLTSTVKGSVRIYREREKDTAANGTQICWLITAGCLYGRHQQKNTRDKTK
jgi:hypothetical protein